MDDYRVLERRESAERNLQDIRRIEVAILDEHLLNQPWMGSESRSFERVLLSFQEAQKIFLEKMGTGEIEASVSLEEAQKNFQDINRSIGESIKAGMGIRNAPLGHLLAAAQSSTDILRSIAQNGRLPEALIRAINSWSFLEQWAVQHLEDRYRRQGKSFSFDAFRVDMLARLRTLAKAFPAVGVTPEHMIKAILDKAQTAYSLVRQEGLTRRKPHIVSHDALFVPSPRPAHKNERKINMNEKYI